METGSEKIPLFNWAMILLMTIFQSTVLNYRTFKLTGGGPDIPVAVVNGDLYGGGIGLDQAMRTLANLESMQSLVHDYWFDLNQIVHDNQRATVKLGLGEHKKGPYDERIITVTNVLEIKSIDEARIQIYTLNRIEGVAGCVRLISNFPLEVRLKVGEGSELSIEDSRGDCYYLPVSELQ